MDKNCCNCKYLGYNKNSYLYELREKECRLNGYIGYFEETEYVCEKWEAADWARDGGEPPN